MLELIFLMKIWIDNLSVKHFLIYRFKYFGYKAWDKVLVENISWSKSYIKLSETKYLYCYYNPILIMK